VHIAAEPQSRFAFQKKVCEARRDIEAPGNKFLLTTYRDFVLPEARCLSKLATKVVNNYTLSNEPAGKEPIIFKNVVFSASSFRTIFIFFSFLWPSNSKIKLYSQGEPERGLDSSLV